MNKQNLKVHIKEVEGIYKEIENAEKRDRINGNLLSHLEMFSEKLRYFDHGEKDVFYMSEFSVLKKIESLEEDFNEKQFQTAYSTVRKRLLSILKKYLKEMKNGLEELD
tara:strand:- start:411 stop:737 length:327 start_codon:yes stop_codon:yes gene_type:complete